MLLPQDFEGWFDLIWKLGAAVITVGTATLVFIRRPLIVHLNGLGERVKKIEAGCAGNEARIGALERTDEVHNFQVAAVSERQGRLEGKIEKIESQLDETLRKIESRLGTIEGQLSIIARRQT